MTEQGYSFVETLLAVIILFFLTFTIVPLTSHMKQQVVNQKVQTHAAEVAFNGALLFSRYGESAGVIIIDDVSYNWIVDATNICVTFEQEKEKNQLCI